MNQALKKLLSILLIVLPGLMKAQNMTYFSIETGPAWDIIRVSDPGNYFTQANIYGRIAGATITQDIIPNLSIGTGAYWHAYSGGLNLEDERPDPASLPSYKSLLIPGRISYRFAFTDIPASLSLSLGYQFGILFSEPVLHNNSSLIVAPDSTVLFYQLSESLSPDSYLHMIEAGVSLDYRFENNWMVSAAFKHYSGLADIKTSTISYLENTNTTAIAGNVSNDGSRFQTTFTLHAPISNLWHKKDERLHARIERSRLSGSALPMKHYIYFGADLGAIWRSFSSSNPAINARPMTGRGVFRYSNLHTGAYIGYLLNDHSGIDIGAYYQRSSSFYSAMYDHEVDFVTKAKAPLFLEVPLMYRYYVDLYKRRILLSLKGGASMLTHFNAQSQSLPGGTFDLSGSQATISANAGRIARFGFMLKAGAGVEYKLPIKIPLQASVDLTYNMGLRDIHQVNVSTSLGELPSASQVNYSGSGWVATIGVKMPFLLGKSNRACKALPMTRGAKL